MLVNSNMQPINKPAVPTVIRNNGDITKTTMVNILPISAYSHPLSASKTRKCSIKLKTDTTKKSIRKTKPSEKRLTETTKKRDSVDIKTKENDLIDTKLAIDSKNEKDYKEPQKNNESVKHPVSINKSVSTENNTEELNIESSNNAVLPKSNIETVNKVINDVKTNDVHSKDSLKATTEGIVTNIDKPKTPESTDTGKITIPNSKLVPARIVDTVSNEKNNRNSKNISDNENIPHDKYKENKLPNLLETTLCDGTVEGGNARLELAEEFLAASPTAAFLMSFPLVSGNRADSPAEEPQVTIHTTTKENINHRRNELIPQSTPFFDKSNNEVKSKSITKQVTSETLNKPGDEQKYIDELTNKESQPIQSKIANTIVTSNASGDNPFLNLPMTSLIPTSFISDPSFGLDLECNVNKTTSNQTTSYVSSNNLFYKADPFATVKNNIYSTSGISSTHELHSLGLYPCAVEKYSSKTKSDYSNVEENLIKMGPSRLTYDIDLGWSHKSFDFVNCTTTTSSFSKDILTTVSAPYSTSYNPFNPEFHVPLVTNSNKKDNSTKTTTFAESISNFYSQPSNLWTEDVPFYTGSTSTKTISSKPQHYLHFDHVQTNASIKHDAKSYNTKQSTETSLNVLTKPTATNLEAQVAEKFTKKSPQKMHINWMTSEVKSMQNIGISTQGDNKEVNKSTYSQLDYKTYNHTDNATKKQDQSDSNYFPITMHNYPTQTTQEEFQIWPSARPLGTAEVTIEPPPINLPTLVGDLALGPHDKKKNTDVSNRVLPHTDIQNCGNFLSVTQLMNRSTDNMHARYQAPNIDIPKTGLSKENNSHFTSDTNRKLVTARIGNHVPQPSYVFNDSKVLNTYDNNFTQFPQSKVKSINKNEKSTKMQKNNYSAEALIRGGSCSQKMQDTSSSKFVMGSQKYSDYNTTQDSVAQVSHFPPILDYSDNNYTGQQFSGTTLYNSTTNTISNSFYSNFMPGSNNLMTGNYTSGPFTGDFIDYSQTTECNYSNNKYEELKMRSNNSVFHQEKPTSNYKSSRRESGAKHKLECSKKESNKKCQNKRVKLNTDVEDWADTSHLLWQNKSSNKRHPNLVPDELPFTNYVSNQMTAQYQPELFNSHLIPSNMQSVGHNMDRSLAAYPGTSRANFNLSTIFPEITMVSLYL